MRWLRAVMILIMFLAHVPLGLSGNDVMLKIDSVPVGAEVSIEGMNNTFRTPVILSMSEGKRIIKISKGAYTVLYNLSISEGEILTLLVDFRKIEKAIGKAFINVTIKYGFNITVPTKEKEYEPPMATPTWEGCGGITMEGSRNPPMVIYQFDPEDPYYQLVLNNTPIRLQYKNIVGCIVVEKIFYHGEGYTVIGGGGWDNATYIAPTALLTINSTPQNATVYIFDFHRFGEWFTPMELRVPVITEPQMNVRVYTKYSNLTIPYIPELHAYKISIGHNGYPFFEGWVDLKPNETLTLNVDLGLLKEAVTVKKEEGVLEVVSQPENASITVKDAQGRVLGSGTSPLRIELPPGFYVISAFMDGYGSAVKNATVFSNKTIRVYVELNPTPAKLSIESSPSGAVVLVENKKCTTPCNLTIHAGDYNITIRKEGFIDESKRVILNPGEEVNLTFNLTPKPRVIIKTTPSGAVVTADETKACTTPCNITLDPGKHILKLDLDGYESEIVVLQLNKGDVVPINIKLRPEQDAFNNFKGKQNTNLTTTQKDITKTQPTNLETSNYGKLLFIVGILALLIAIGIRR